MKRRFISCLLFILIFNICGGDASSNSENEKDQQSQNKDVIIIDYPANEVDVDRLIECIVSKGWDNIPKIEEIGNTVKQKF